MALGMPAGSSPGGLRPASPTNPTPARPGGDTSPLNVGDLHAPGEPLSKPLSADAPAASGQAAGVGHHPAEPQYKRKAYVSGTGAIRCRTFHTKLNDGALAFLDHQVNTWLEQHGYEVKSSSMTIGQFQGKTMESHLIVQVWY